MNLIKHIVNSKYVSILDITSVLSRFLIFFTYLVSDTFSETFNLFSIIFDWIQVKFAKEIIKLIQPREYRFIRLFTLSQIIRSNNRSQFFYSHTTDLNINEPDLRWAKSTQVELKYKSLLYQLLSYTVQYTHPVFIL